MRRQVPFWVPALTIGACIYGGSLTCVWAADNHGHHGDAQHQQHDGYQEAEEHGKEGPHGGRLLESGDFALEITLFEQGVAPEFRVYPYHGDRPLAPARVQLEIVLQRLGGRRDAFRFEPEGGYLRGQGEVGEPHSFDVKVKAVYDGDGYEWKYESHEGRTSISAAALASAGVETGTAGPALIRESLLLYGTVRPNEERVMRIAARFAGLVRSVKAGVGDQVKKGQVLAVIESSESLQTYRLRAPMAGTILSRQVNAGELAGTRPLFTLADLSEVWVDFAAFPSQVPRLAGGQQVFVRTADGRVSGTTRLDYLSPVGSSASQSILARAVLGNPSGQWKPGLLVTGLVTVARTEVPLAVRASALQRFRDFDVVFAKFGDTYEVRMLELGRRDDGYVEVLKGLDPGTEYVTQNSYLIKADVLKSGAGHDH